MVRIKAATRAAFAQANRLARSLVATTCVGTRLQCGEKPPWPSGEFSQRCALWSAHPHHLS